jgi:hypothetical protein
VFATYSHFYHMRGEEHSTQCVCRCDDGAGGCMDEDVNERQTPGRDRCAYAYGAPAITTAVYRL